MSKIAFVVLRYGNNINGGAEFHCKMLAERLSKFYDVEILTTCATNHHTFNNELPEGNCIVDGINVKRFLCNSLDDDYKDLTEPLNVKLLRKIRRILFKVGLLQYLSGMFSRNISDKYSARLLGSLSNSPDLINYLENNIDRYYKFIFITAINDITISGINVCGKKSILIPTAHNEGRMFLPVFCSTFNYTGNIAFNTESERRLCHKIFGNYMANNAIIGTGIEVKAPSYFSEINNKLQINSDYILYIGRLDKGKLGSVLQYFIKFKSENNTDLKLVLVGAKFCDLMYNDDVIYAGFVSEAEKSALLQNAVALVNPSKYESLSLVVLEAMYLQVPVLVNGDCEVLRNHVKNSKAGFYYRNYSEFNFGLTELLNSKQLRDTMGKHGLQYVEANYNWGVIINKLRQMIDN